MLYCKSLFISTISSFVRSFSASRYSTLRSARSKRISPCESLAKPFCINFCNDATFLEEESMSLAIFLSRSIVINSCGSALLLLAVVIYMTWS